MPLYRIYNSKHQYLGTYAAPKSITALVKCERDCIEGGSKWIGGYAKLAADCKD